MPCNAVATVRAQVAQETLLAELTPALTQELVQAYLRRAYPRLSCRALPAPADGCAFQVGPLTLTLAGGRITASGATYGVETAEEMLRDLPTAVADLLTRAGGLLLQNRVRATLAARYGIESEQRAPNGAVVLHIDL